MIIIENLNLSIKNKNEINDKDNLISLINILSNHFKYLLLEINKKLYDTMEMI